MRFFCYPFPQELPCALVLAFAGAFRDAQVPCNFLMAEIFQRIQHEYFPAAPWKILYLFLYQGERDIQPPFRSLVLDRKRFILLQATPPDMIFTKLNAFIDHYPPQPAGKSPGLFQLSQVPECIDKCILKHVLGIGRIACHPDTDIIHGFTEMPVEISLSATVALSGLNYGQFRYVGWMLQVLVTIQSCQ